MLERLVAADAPVPGSERPGDERLVAQQLDPRMVARVAARRGAQALADDLEAGGRAPRRRGRRAAGRAVVDDGGAEALELVAGQLVVARARVQPSADSCA